MKVWLTTAEIAALALPGVPATRQGVDHLAAREKWADGRLARPRAGREGGGGLEFHLDLLPLPARLAHAARHFAIAPEDLRPALTEGDGLTARARETRDARLVLLRLADRFRHDQNLSTIAADTLFSGLFNTGSMALPPFVKGAVEKLSARTLARWRALRQARGDAALGHDPGAARKGTGALDMALDGQVRTFVLATIAKMPFLSTRRALELVEARFGAALPATPLRTFQRQLAVWKADYANELQYLTDPDGYRSKTEFALTVAAKASRLNELWQIDASPADVMLKDGRHSIYLVIDVHSRRTKVLATPTPRAAGVGLLVRKAILAWGVPERIKIDNGSDFAARATQRLFSALAIEVDFSAPYSPKAKGMVERAIGTFQRDLAGLPGFVGHSVADRKVLEGRKAFARRLGADEAELFGVDLDLGEFQAWCDDWTDQIYAHTPHEGIGRRTPFAVAAAHEGAVRRVEDARTLDVLLAPAPGRDGLRTVTKTGVKIDRAHYLTGAVMVGETVFCRMDPADLGRVLLFSPDGETFLGEAVAPELAGLDPVETIQTVKAMQKAYLEGRMKPIRADMKKIGARDVADAMRAAAARRAGNVLAFPGRSERHETPQMDAAARAVDPARAAGLTGRAAELHAEMMAGSGTPAGASPSSGPSGHLLPVNGEKEGVARLPETREQRFRRALEFEKRLADGDELGARDLLWLGGYREGSEYRAMRTVFEEFGAAAIGP